MATLFDGFYQMGFVVADIAAAMETLGRVHGVTRFRHRAGAAWMDAAHAWVGSTMIELIEPREGAPAIYTAEPPPAAGAMRLHHHGYRVQERPRVVSLRRPDGQTVQRLVNEVEVRYVGSPYSL